MEDEFAVKSAMYANAGASAPPHGCKQQLVSTETPYRGKASTGAGSTPSH